MKKNPGEKKLVCNAFHFFGVPASREAFHLVLAAIRAKIRSRQGEAGEGPARGGTTAVVAAPHMWKLCAFCSFLIDQQIYLIR